METDSKDYLYSGCMIGLILGVTALLVGAIQSFVAAYLGPYAAIALFFLFAFTYGGITVLGLAALAAWLPLRPGDYATDAPQFTLWKVQHVVGELGKVALSLFFPVFARPTFYAFFGARVGSQVAVAGKILDPRLTVLEDGCVLGEGCIVTSHAMVKGRFVLRQVSVGEGATVGVGSLLMPGVAIGAGAVILPGSVLKADTKVPARETWGGVPAVRLKGATD
jgi:acetyltransferase-like isoleucine patch superfamily enzyme